MDRVERRVLEDEDPRRHLEVGPDDLENAALGRAERLAIDQTSLDVLEPAHRIEVVRLVVVQRRFVPETTVHRVRVGVDIRAVRVVVQTSDTVDAQPKPSTSAENKY